MSRGDIFVCGSGAVSPAGWGVPALREALVRGEALPAKDISRPGLTQPLRARDVPPPAPRPPFLSHARLRRTSPIAHYAVASAMEALGDDASRCSSGAVRLGIVFCAMSGCVNYSRRFYDEVLKDPGTASPLVFPETVYNSPASHLAALLGVTAVNYTLVGDPGTFAQGLALAADWIIAGTVDGCVVVGAEEMDWLTADSSRLFDREVVVASGAGALYLRSVASPECPVQLSGITDSHLYSQRQSRARAIEQTRVQMPGSGEGELLCDSAAGSNPGDAAEQRAWSDWRGGRLSPARILGVSYIAGAAWQCVAAVDAVSSGRFRAANVSVGGINQQSIGVRFERVENQKESA